MLTIPYTYREAMPYKGMSNVITLASHGKAMPKPPSRKAQGTRQHNIVKRHTSSLRAWYWEKTPRTLLILCNSSIQHRALSRTDLWSKKSTHPFIHVGALELLTRQFVSTPSKQYVVCMVGPIDPESRTRVRANPDNTSKAPNNLLSQPIPNSSLQVHGIIKTGLPAWVLQRTQMRTPISNVASPSQPGTRLYQQWSPLPVTQDLSSVIRHPHRETSHPFRSSHQHDKARLPSQIGRPASLPRPEDTPIRFLGAVVASPAGANVCTMLRMRPLYGLPSP